MGATQNLSSLNCNLKIIRAKNVEFVSVGNLFVRYYLLTEKDTRIRLTSRDIPSTCEPCWNESITFECLGDKDVINKLTQQSVVFELRWRKAASAFGKFGGSKLLFRAEVRWKDVLESAEISIEKWITSATTSKFVPEGFKPPALQIEMRVDQKAFHMPKRCQVRSTKWNECGCRNGCCHGRDEDIFALAAAMEVL
ncbi:hypothetical protein IFM89_005282 [Coptis chinensis]|uniref:C2 domain-containing protein n=1 Tax=Coptis chinensis TaxID=261450 RepID=A0A835ITX2_9MAGN|nr:hypothetical protein IFM89_005282 [Coptis chinensis]